MTNMTSSSQSSLIATIARIPLEQSIYASIRALAPVIRAPQTLPADFLPSKYDVICGKGKQCYNHIGNRRFRVTIGTHVPRYQAAKTKSGKTAIVNSIVDIIRESKDARFVRYNKITSEWMELGDTGAREKVGQAIRDIVSSQRDPAQKARKAINEQRRKEESNSQFGCSLFSESTYEYQLDVQAPASASSRAPEPLFNRCQERPEVEIFSSKDLFRIGLPRDAEIPDLSSFFEDEDLVEPEPVSSAMLTL
jgi:hypothetical protein